MKLRGALLGAGNIAQRSHAPLWARDERLRREIEIVAVADLAAANREAVRAILPDARLYADAEELLERESLDFCDICTPPFTHRRLIERAARKGLHILCEKPLALTVDEAREIARAVREAGVAFMPCHQYHYSPQWQAVRTLLPRLGRLHFAEFEVLRTAANEGNPHWSPAWRTQRASAGGGILVDHGAHILYQLYVVLGEPRTLQATVGRLVHHDYDVEDTALVTLHYGDRLARISLTWAARQRAIRFRFEGECGELHGDDRRIRVEADRTEEISFEDGLSKNSWHAEWYRPLAYDFLDQIRNGRGTQPLEEAVYVTRVTVLAYESAELGRVLPFAPEDAPAGATDTPAATRRLDGAPRAAGAAEPISNGHPPEPISNGHPPQPISNAHSTQPISAPLAGVAALGPQGSLGKILPVAVITIIAAFALWSVRHLQWRDLWQAVRTADVRWLALAAAVNLLVIGLAAVRWFQLLRPISPTARLRHAFEATTIGFAVSTIVPARAGELARMRWLHRRTGLSQIAIVGSMGLDQVLNAAGLIACLGLLPWIAGVPPWIARGSALAIGLFVLAIVAMLLLRRRDSRAERDREPPAASAPSLLERIRLGLAATRSPAALVRSLAASLIAWALELVVTGLALRALGIALPISASVLVLVAVNLLIAVPFGPPANVGMLEIGATLALVGLGVPKERALAFALCYHALQVVPNGLLGLAFAGSDLIRKQPTAIHS